MTKFKRTRPSFFKAVIGDFANKLCIPQAFVEDFNGSITCKSTLKVKSPSRKSWVVKVVEIEDGLFFIGNGWHQFVKDNSIECGDFLVFKYYGKSDFSVKIYDKSACEKKVITGPPKMNNNDHHPNFQDKNENPNEVIVIKQEWEPENCKPDNENKVIRHSNKGGCEKSEKKPEAVIDGKKPVGQPIHTLSKMENHHASSGTINWRLVTLAERSNALKLAQAASTTESLIVVMRPTHVYKRFYMAIPVAWMKKHLTLESQDVILRLKEETWNVIFNFVQRRSNGGLSGGWRKFVKDNKLDEFDVCVFTPARLITKPVILDVAIFRVVSEVVSQPALEFF